MNKSKKLDQFYTNPNVAKYFFNIIESEINNLNNKLLLEPSAGYGSFSNLFINNYSFIAFDLEPKSNFIYKSDFLKINLDKSLLNKSIITIGNPPFGYKSKLAIDFFNKASEFSDYICFILPKTFKKNSIKNRLNLNMFLIYEEDVKKNSFLFENKPYNVPCVFQIWEKNLSKKRDKIKKKTQTNLFQFVEKRNADFCIRRIGNLSGKIFNKFNEYKENSNYFIKIEKDINKQYLFEIINKSYNELNNIAKNTVGNPSLSKTELIEIIESKFN